MKLKGLKKAKKSGKAKKTAKIESIPPENILICEATGNKVRFNKEEDLQECISGQRRVFSSREVATAHKDIEDAKGVRHVHRNCVYADPNKNVRRFSIKAAEFLDLMESIKEEGILQPLLVHRSSEHLPALYELRAGFRRFEVAKKLDIPHIPIVILDDDVNPKVAGILENLREDMKPIEMATAIKAIMDEGIIDKKTGKKIKLSQRKVAKMVGVSQSRISDLLGLVGDLHSKVSRAVTDGELPVSKAALLKQLPPKDQVKGLKLAADLDVKDLRKYVQDQRESLGLPPPAHQAKPEKTQMKGRKFRVRPVGELFDACLSAEKSYFKGKKTPSNKAVVSVFQWLGGMIETYSSDPVDPVEFQRKVEEEAERKKQERLENLKKGREARQAKVAKKKGSGKKKDEKKGDEKKGDEKKPPAKGKAKPNKAKLPKVKTKKPKGNK